MGNELKGNFLHIGTCERKIKTYKGEWYTINSIFGNDWAIFFALLGGREAGKSYSAMQWAVNRKFKLKVKKLLKRR